MDFFTIYNRLSFTIMLLIAEFVLCSRFPKKKNSILLMILGSIPPIACAFFWADVFPAPNQWISATRYLAVFIISLGTMALVYKGDFWAYLFVGVMGYCVQHISYRGYRLIGLIFDYKFPLSWEMVLLPICSVPVYVATYFYFTRKLKKGEIFIVNNKFQTMVAFIVLVITAYLSVFGVRHVSDREGAMVVVLFSISACMLAIFLEGAFLQLKKDEAELSVLKHMVHAAKSQFNDSRESIELINVKCHDLRHQLSALKGKIDEEELDRITEAVDIYDNDFKTGNDALDVVLTEKGLLCKKKGVRLTCMVDGSSLSGMSPSDIYCFFGNALENAIQSVENLDDDRKVISISEIRRGNLSDIRIENYFDGTIELKEGLPQTQKDTRYHGFGVKSMFMIAEKYGGALSVTLSNDIFCLDVLIPTDTEHKET